MYLGDFQGWRDICQVEALTWGVQKVGAFPTNLDMSSSATHHSELELC